MENKLYKAKASDSHLFRDGELIKYSHDFAGMMIFRAVDLDNTEASSFEGIGYQALEPYEYVEVVDHDETL